ncbi:MAG: MBL fold metallo-hydrolase [Myxococcota bacterium]
MPSEERHPTSKAPPTPWLRRAIGALLGTLGLVLALGFSLGACLSAPGYQGPPKGNFNGERFVNLVPTPDKGMTAYLRMRTQETRVAWPTWVEIDQGAPPPPRITEPGHLRVTVINHATVLLQMDGLNILTDPVWSERVGPFSWVGTQRVRDPGIAFDDLPPIDIVAISHNHYDHLDIPTLERIYAQGDPLLFAGLGTRALLAEHGIRPSGGSDMLWWETLPTGNKGQIQITAVPAQHWSGRGLNDQKNTLWMGFVFKGSAGPVYFAGDTGWGPHFALIAERFPGIRLALLPIGAYSPEWFMATNHISPRQAVEAHVVLGAQHSIPIHYGTFPLGLEGLDDPIVQLKAALADQRVPPDRFSPLAFGQGRTLRP